MKGGFIEKFFGCLAAIERTIGDILIYESMSRKMIRMGGTDPDKVYKGFKNLAQRGILDSLGNGRYRFTEKGMSWRKSTKYSYFLAMHPRWDHKWRIVVFDIPQTLTKNRNIFRRRLKWMGFRALQKSVLILPYPCEQELGDICKDLNIGDYVDIFTAESAGYHESELLKHFQLK